MTASSETDKHDKTSDRCINVDNKQHATLQKLTIQLEKTQEELYKIRKELDEALNQKDSLLNQIAEHEKQQICEQVTNVTKKIVFLNIFITGIPQIKTYISNMLYIDLDDCLYASITNPQ
jgi:chromosome segregation ATPase